MSGLSRFAVAAVLIAGFAGIAQAQSHSRPATFPQDQYMALDEGKGGTADSAVDHAGAVPPSESQTVMGLRVPH